MQTHTNQRRNFWIKKEFQGRFILSFALLGITLAALMGGVLYETIRRVLDARIYSSHLHVQSSGDLVAGLLLKTNVGAVVGILLLVIGVSLVIFNRFNHHFRVLIGTLEDMSAGDYASRGVRKSHFGEISLLYALIEQARQAGEERSRLLRDALLEVEAGCAARPDVQRLRNAEQRLEEALRGLQLP